MKARAFLSAALPLLCLLLCPLAASALVVDKPTFSLTFGSDWIDGLLADPGVPFHTLADTAHGAPGFLQGMPLAPGASADEYLRNVTLTLVSGRYTRTDSSGKQLGSHRFQTSGWAESDPEDPDDAETLRLYTLDAGGVAFFAWMSYDPGGEPAVAEFEAALATLQIKSGAIRDRGFRPGAAAAPARAERLDLLGRARTTAGRIPDGYYILRAR